MEFILKKSIFIHMSILSGGDDYGGGGGGGGERDLLVAVAALVRGISRDPVSNG